MLVPIDLLVKQTLEDELRSVKADPTLVNDIFAGLAVDELAVIRRTFASLAVPVKLGYPRDVAELPGLFVILGAMSEAEQVIGEGFDEEVFHHEIEGEPGNPLFWEERRGTFFQSTARVMCWTENANLTVWLQNVVTWALLRRREDLTEAGLLEQRVGASDFEPLPRWFPTFAYRRDVTVTAKHVGTFVAKIRPIAAVQADGRVGADVVTVRIER